MIERTRFVLVESTRILSLGKDYGKLSEMAAASTLVIIVTIL